MYLLLDSTVYVADWNFNSPHAQVLATRWREAGLRMLIPQVVVDEVCNKYREHVSKLLEGKERLDRMLPRAVSPNAMPALDEICAKWNSEFAKRLDDLGGSILPYPNRSHSEVAARAIAGRKPFSQRADGYRDTLIWLSMLEYLRSAPAEFTFVSKNSGDFANNAGPATELHPDLLADLAQLPRAPVKSHYYLSLDAFVGQWLERLLARLDDLKARLNDNKDPIFSLRTWVAAEVPRLLPHPEVARSIWGSPDDVIADRYMPLAITAQEVRRFQEDEAFIRGYTMLRLIFSHFPSHGVAPLIARGYLLVSRPGTFAEVWVDLQVFFTLILRESSGEVLTAAVESFKVLPVTQPQDPVLISVLGG